MKWQLKCLKNAALGILPNTVQESARTLKRAYFPYNLKLNHNTLNQGLQQVRLLKTAGCDPYGKDYLELGTGWSPVIPLIFSLAGCKSLTLVDSQRLMDAQVFAQTCEQLQAHKVDIAAQLNIAISEVERLTTLVKLPLEAALASLRCRYLAPCDLLHSELAIHSLDIITSRAVLEHVPPEQVQGLFSHFYQLLRPDGFMCHIIDNSDHWEFNDQSISRLNFLRYSPRVFGLISALNPLDYQNRLRHSEYKTLLKTAGFKIIQDASVADAQALADLRTLPLHASFQAFEPEDLAILTSYLVATKADVPPNVPSSA